MNIPYTTHYLIIGASVIIIFSYFFNIVSKKTHIPSVLLLIGLGIVIQLFFNFNQKQLMAPLELLGNVGLIMIVLEAALDLHLSRDKWPIIWRSILVALILLGGTSMIIAYLFHQTLFGANFYQALVYAVPLSIMSSAIVIPSVESLSGKKREFMVMESAFSDIFGIMFFYYLLDLYASKTVGDVLIEITKSLGITLTLSLAISYLLVVAFQNITSKIKLFLLVAVLLLLYSTGKLFHLSSLIIILLFGLILNNYKVFFKGILSKLLNHEALADILKNLHLITLETAFVVRTFFFVIFGITVSVNNILHWKVIMVSAAILIGTYLLRYIFLKLFVGKNINPELYINPRGLITLLLFYGITETFKTTDTVIAAYMSDIVLAVIIATNLIMTFALIKNGGGKKEKVEPLPEETPASPTVSE